MSFCIDSLLYLSIEDKNNQCHLPWGTDILSNIIKKINVRCVGVDVHVGDSWQVSKSGGTSFPYYKKTRHLASKYDSKPLVKLKKNTACLNFSEQNGIGKREMCSVSFEKLPFFPKKDKKKNNVICSDVLIFYRILYQIHG
jgi:hypothetical protein